MKNEEYLICKLSNIQKVQINDQSDLTFWVTRLTENFPTYNFCFRFSSENVRKRLFKISVNPRLGPWSTLQKLSLSLPGGWQPIFRENREQIEMLIRWNKKSDRNGIGFSILLFEEEAVEPIYRVWCIKPRLTFERAIYLQKLWNWKMLPRGFLLNKEMHSGAQRMGFWWVFINKHSNGLQHVRLVAHL